LPLSDRAIRNVFIYLVPKFLTYGLGLLTLPILTRLLAPEEYGIVAMAWILPNIAVAAVTGGLGFSIPRFYFEYRTDQARLDALVCSGQLFMYAMLPVSALGVWFAREQIAQWVIGDPIYGQAVFVGYVVIYLEHIMVVYLRLYQNMEKAVKHSIAILGKAIAQAGASLLFVWGLGMNHMGLIYAALVGVGGMCFILAIDINRMFGRGFRLRDLMENMKYGMQIVPKSFTGTLNRFFDKYLLRSVLSLTVVGVYAIGQQLAGTVNYLISTIWMAFQPEAYREVFDRGEEASASVGRLLTVFATVSLGIVLLVALFAQELVQLVAPESYYAAIDVLVILCGAAGVQVFGVSAGLPFAYSKRPAWITAASFLAAVASVSLNLLLIPRFGANGAALAAVIAQALSVSMIVWVGRRHYYIAFEWRTIVAMYAVLVTAITSVLYMRSVGVAWPISYLVKGTLLMGFMAIGARAGILTKQTMARLWGVLATRPGFVQMEETGPS